MLDMPEALQSLFKVSTVSACRPYPSKGIKLAELGNNHDITEEVIEDADSRATTLESLRA
jgi:hypothetical protein